MAWFDITDPFFWKQDTPPSVFGTWNGTEFVPDAQGRIRRYFNNYWMDGQSPGYWRFTLNVTSGALGNTSDLTAFVLNASLSYNWDSTLSFSLSSGVNTKEQVIFFGGANSHLGNVRAFDLNGRDSMVYTLTKIEFSDVVIPEPAETRCILYKHTGFSEIVDVINPSTTTSGPYGTYGTGTRTGNVSVVSTISPEWATAVRFGGEQVRNSIGRDSSPAPGGRSGGGSGGGEGDWTSRGDLVFVVGVDSNGNRGGQLYKKDRDGNLTEPSGPFIPSPSGPEVGQ